VSERTLILVKPDGVARGLSGQILARIEAKGFTLVALELKTLDRATREAHYGEHVDKPFSASWSTSSLPGRCSLA
jgi:nucleoside-diphosphate kinase